MYSQLAIVVAIDAEATLESASLAGNIYAVDNNRFNGSSGQGTSALTSVVVGCQVVNWLAGGIDWSRSDLPVSIKAVKGEAVEKQILIPQLYDSPVPGGGGGYWWGGTADAAVPGVYGYTLTFNIANKMDLDWDLRLDIREGFTMESAEAETDSTAAESVMPRAVADGSINDAGNFIQVFRRRIV